MLITCPRPPAVCLSVPSHAARMVAARTDECELMSPRDWNRNLAAGHIRTGAGSLRPQLAPVVAPPAVDISSGGDPTGVFSACAQPCKREIPTYRHGCPAVEGVAVAQGSMKVPSPAPGRPRWREAARVLGSGSQAGKFGTPWLRLWFGRAFAPGKQNQARKHNRPTADQSSSIGCVSNR